MKISSRTRNQILKRCDDSSAPAAARGKAFEDLLCCVLSKVRGANVSNRNVLNSFHSEEIDIAVFNDRRNGNLHFLHDFFLVECKNWSSPVGSIDVVHFIDKLRNRSLPDGVLVAANGITGDPVDLSAARHAIANALRDNRRIILITKDEVVRLVSGSDFEDLVKKRLLELYANLSPTSV